MTSSRPIGVFDSGFGGLTIFREIRRRFPQYDFIYLGDNARTPYGNRSFETVLKFSTEAVEFLFHRGCPLIIFACNTASAKALRSIQQTWLVQHFPHNRVLGVIRPTVEVIGRYTRTGHVGLWATAGTVKSESFVLEMEKHAPGIKLFQQACPLLVPLVEAGELTGEGLRYFLNKYWQLTLAQSPDIDTLLLACTHYPLLLPEIRQVVPSHVRVVAQDEIVPPSLEDYLNRHPEMESRISRGGTTTFLTTDQEKFFDDLARIFMGDEVSSCKADLEDGFRV